MSAVVSADGVCLSRGATPVLDGVNVSVDTGEVVAVLGPSGSGKSTLVRVLLGLEPPDAGVVRIHGRTASEPKRVCIAPEAREFAVVFQDLALWPHMTVAQNLGFVLRASSADDRIAAMLERVGLADKRERHPAELSGGEKQRVAIARALVTEPKLILLDEPLSNLDVVMAADLLDLFGTLFDEHNMAALYVTHEPREAARLADRIAILEAGQISQTGTLDELRAHPATRFVERAFDGSS